MTGMTDAGEALHTPCSGPSVWRGGDLADREEWILRFSSRQLAEIDSALREARRRDLTLLKLTAADFPLPTLAGELRRIAQVLDHGRGFALVKGLRVEQLGGPAASTVFWGLGQYLGRPVPQNADGHILGHVRDTGRSLTDPATRGYQTRAALPFHTDGADLLALLCLRTPRAGGRTSLVSSAAVHNAVLDLRPDLAKRLYRTYYFDRRQEHPPEEPPYADAPLAARPGGALSMRYNRCYLESAQRFPQVPRLEPADLELFDLMDEVASSPEFRLDIDLEAGDLLLLNTHTIMHARSEFEDHDQPELKRHLLRLWLALPHRPRSDGARDGVTPRDVIRPRNAASQADTNPRRLPA
ncbi:TauD/TfdA family dioxygenase [Streptomyces sp. NBC_01236]|uniref:TauD/TfdA family dioxygenase n=1 Tax=Streptomyces sp. NBC_01236 TaxID=2903789 RepID=UPI002E0E7DB5|nr:TauD/TfdA family dioxygenase [Streptomyces sp. NBC_01236]